MEIDKRGILLTNKIGMEFLKNLTPRYYKDYCKFVVDTESKRCCVGMY